MLNFSQRLFRAIVPGILFILLTVGLVLDILVVEQLKEEFDQRLVIKSQSLIALFEIEEGEAIIDEYEKVHPQFVSANDAEYFQFTDFNGVMLANSLSMPPEKKLISTDNRNNKPFSNIELPDKRRGRVMRSLFLPTFEVTPGGDGIEEIKLDPEILPWVPDQPDASTQQRNDRPMVILNIAISREPLDQVVMQVHLLLILSGLLTMAIITYLARRQINETVKPLGLVTEQISSLDPLQLDQRIQVPAPVMELHLLVNQFNSLLDQVEGNINRERRFSGDVAHELRTPLAELRNMLEVKQRWPDDPELEKSFSQDINRSTDRMQRLVESLLALSRAEKEATELEPFDDFLSHIENELVTAQKRAAKKGMKILYKKSSHPVVVHGKCEWQLIISNLLDNAIEYGTLDSTIDVEVMLIQAENNKTKTVAFKVCNQTDLICEQDIPHLFERFWRKDTSRTSDRHSGLGLALVATCVNRVNAAVNANLSDGVFTVAVLAPLVQE